MPSSAAQDQLDAAQQELAAAKATLARDQALYAYTRITAPFDGVVTELDGYTGALLPASTSTSANGLALCHLSQNDLLRLVIPVPETSVPGIRIGEAVQVNVSALNRRFPGKVVRFSDRIDLKTIGQRSVYVQDIGRAVDGSYFQYNFLSWWPSSACTPGGKQLMRWCSAGWRPPARRRLDGHPRLSEPTLSASGSSPHNATNPCWCGNSVRIQE